MLLCILVIYYTKNLKIKKFKPNCFSTARVQLLLEGGTGQIVLEGSVPDFLRKPIATCDFPEWEGSGPAGPPLLDSPMHFERLSKHE